MRFRLAVLGTEIFLVELTRQDPTALLAEAITELQGPIELEKLEEDKANQFGVSGCHIERSSETDDWGEGEKSRFGFHVKNTGSGTKMDLTKDGAA
jgi:hypothetical protein